MKSSLVGSPRDRMPLAKHRSSCLISGDNAGFYNIHDGCKSGRRTYRNLPLLHKHAVKRESIGIRFVHSVGMIKVNGRLELKEDACPSTPLALPKRSVRE